VRYTPSHLVRWGVLAAALALAGCESLSNLNPFQERERPLAGQRKPVFPPGDPYAGPQRATLPTTHASAAQAGSTAPASEAKR
jgi:hypothetical protein